MAKVIAIFILFCLLIGNASAELQSGTITLSDTERSEFTTAVSSCGTSSFQINQIYFKNVAVMSDWQITWMILPDATFTGASKATETSMVNSVDLKIGATTVGKARLGYYSPNEGANWYIYLSPQDDETGTYYFDPTGFTGAQYVTISGHSGANYKWETTGAAMSAPTNYDSQLLDSDGGSFCAGVPKSPVSIVMHTESYATYTTDYFWETQGINKYFKYERSVSAPAQLYIIDEGSNEIINETSIGVIQQSNYTFFGNPFFGNDTWYLTALTDFGASSGSIPIYFDDGVTTTGNIYLDKSSYVDPENITVSYTLNSANFAKNKYRILFYEDILKDGSSWREILAMDYNESRILSASSGSLLADLQSDHYFLPIGFKVKLVETNLDTYASITLDETGIIQYGPAVPFDYLVQGVIYDAYSSNPISTARVNFTSGTVLETYDYTSSLGGYRVGLLGGFYEITVTKAGYETYSESHYIDENQTLNIPLTATTITDGEVYGIVTDAETSLPVSSATIQVYNSTGFLDVDYSTDSGYYSILGLTNDSTYTIKVIRRDYFVYLEDFVTETSGSTLHNVQLVTIEDGAVTPTTTATYPGGSGVAWTNDDITTMLRVTIPGIFMIILIMLLMAVLTGSGGRPRDPGPCLLYTSPSPRDRS